mmetsp:Transcript_1477/g.4263  ORF Transcript_1477/g.4263 Transcript_1477/m.4263 type:complete len:263 (-) Transcript_1477:688-1476(-)
MKLATSLVLASTGLAAAKKPVAAKKAVDLTASQKIAGRHARKLVRASRKLEDEDNEDNQEEEDEYYFLTNYRMKFVQCVADYKIQGDDAYESSAVIYRLCPNDAQSESAFGCTEDESYGDYVVGINTYTEAIAENMREEAEANGQEDDDEFDLNEYAQCGEADMEMDEDEDEGRKRKLEEVDYYYIGPKCVNVMDSKGKKIVGTDIAVSKMLCSCMCAWYIIRQWIPFCFVHQRAPDQTDGHSLHARSLSVCACEAVHTTTN